MQFVLLLSVLSMAVLPRVMADPPAPEYAQWPTDGSGRAVLTPDPEPGLVIKVDGAASANGDQPVCARLEDALAQARELRASGHWPEGGVRIELAPGVIAVTGTVKIDETMSGQPGAPLVIAAAAGGRVTFTAGITVQGLRPLQADECPDRLPVTARGKVWGADLKQSGLDGLTPLRLGGFASGAGFITHPVVELFMNGQPLRMAQYPEPGEPMLRIAEVTDEMPVNSHGRKGTQKGRIRVTSDRLTAWKQEPEGWLYGYWFWEWADSYEKIAALDAETGWIDLAAPWHTYGYRADGKFVAFNMLCELDQPGEYWIDRQALKLYVYPPASPEGAEWILSVTPAPLLSLENASHIRLVNLDFAYAAGDVVLIGGGTDVRVLGCSVRNAGGTGITVKDCEQHVIHSCDIYNMGRMGISISGGDIPTLKPCGNMVENCHIHHLSRIDHTYTPAVLVNGVGIRLAHNLCDHIPSSAFRIGGREHLIEYNEVHDVVQESDDQGGTDMWGDPLIRGVVFRWNYWHHVGNWDGRGEQLHCGAAGIRLDDAISGVRIYGNIFHKASAGNFGGVQIHGGKDNRIENCVFHACRYGVSFSPWPADRWQQYLDEWFSRNSYDLAQYEERYPKVRALRENPNRNYIVRSFFINCGEDYRNDHDGVVKDAVLSLQAGRTDPFPMAAQGDFSMSEPANPGISGFEKIPFEDIGPYASSWRPEVPPVADRGRGR